MTNKLAASIALICASGTLSTARAQDAAPAPAAASAPSAAASEPTRTKVGPVELTQVVITAERRKKTAQKTAIAITAETGASLENQSKQQLDEAVKNTPGVEIQATAGGAGVFIRGVGSNDTGFGDPSINLNIDGVYQQDPAPVTSGLYDIGRVEVLRGPQGTLYGRNATAGSINVITNDPVHEFEGSASFGIGNYGQRRVDGMVNVPVNDKVALRAAVFANRRDAYIRPSGYNDADQMGGRVKALFDIDRGVRFVLSASYLQEKGSGLGVVDGVGLDDRSDPWQTSRPAGVADHKFSQVSGQLDWDLGPVTLTVIPSYVHAKRYDLSYTSPTTPVEQSEETKQTAAEVRLASNGSTGTSWVAGLLYLDGKYTRFNPDFNYQHVQQLAQEQPLTSYGVFGQLTQTVATGVRLTGGLRYSRDKKSKFDDYISLANGLHVSAQSEPATWNSVDYKAGAELDLTPTSLLYGTFSTGYKAGGFQTIQAPGSASQTFKPEKLRALELGSKNRFMDNRLQINASIFHYTYENYQVKYPVFAGPVLTVPTANATSATKIFGAEFEAAFQVTGNDRVEAGLTFTHAKFGEFVVTANYPFGAVTTNHTGETPPNVPARTAKLAYEHRFDFANAASLTARFETKLSSGYWTSLDHQAVAGPGRFTPLDTYQKGYSRSDFSLAYAPDGKWSLRGYVKNIENKPIRSGGGNNGGSFVYVQAPRTYGVTVATAF